MFRPIHKTISQINERYETISKHEISNDSKGDIEDGLSSVFLMSQNFPIREVADAFSKENFSVLESYLELESSYELIKCGFFKQSMISLRTGFEIGLLSIYWTILGVNSQDFKAWISSKYNTPFKNKKFWEVIKSNENICDFDGKFDFIEQLKKNRIFI